MVTGESEAVSLAKVAIALNYNGLLWILRTLQGKVRGGGVLENWTRGLPTFFFFKSGDGPTEKKIHSPKLAVNRVGGII